MTGITEKLVSIKSEKPLTQIELGFNGTLLITGKQTPVPMIKTCEKCNNAQEETFPTEVLMNNDTGIMVIPICQKCREFWYS